MSFGFGVGDFLAVLKTAKEVKERFSDAPQQYKAISDQVDAVITVLAQIEPNLPTKLTPTQSAALVQTIDPCKGILNEIRRQLPSGIERGKNFWLRLNWNSKKFNELATRLTNSVSALNLLLQEFTRADTANISRKQDHETVLSWLASVSDDYSVVRYGDHLRHKSPGSGQWLFESKEYQEWESNSNGGMLLLKGIPGAGKTMLSTIIIERLKYACYFYCDYRRPEEKQDVLAILTHLLRQLVQDQILDCVYELFESSKYARPSLEAVRTTLQTVISTRSKTYIVIDALDECSTDGCRRKILSELLTLINLKTSVLVTSRSSETLSCPSIDIRASKQDIERYIESQVTALPKFVTKDGLIDEIKTAVFQAADGIFLLVKLYVETLRGRRSPRALRKQLKILDAHAGYTPTYIQTMQRIHSQSDDQTQLAVDALTWMVYAERPLKAQELVHALAVEDGDLYLDDESLPDIEEILDICYGLVIIERTTNIVRLVHKTTQEFFEGEGSKWLPDPHTKLSKTCLTYLSFEGLPTEPSTGAAMQSIRLQFPLYDYASQYWEKHTTNREQTLNLVEFITKQEQIENASKSFLNTMSSDYLELAHKHPGIRGLHLAAYGGLCKIIPELLAHYEINATDKQKKTPLMYAAMNDQVEAIQCLLQNGAQIDCQNEEGETALMAAIRSCFDEEQATMQCLITEGANLDIQNCEGKTALSLVVPGCRGNTSDPRFKADIYKSVMLVSAGARLDIEDNSGMTPLDYMFKQDFGETEYEIRDSGKTFFYIFFHYNTFRTHLIDEEKILHAMRLLFEGRDRYRLYKNMSLTWAIQYKLEHVTDLLLRNGADSNAQDYWDRTPLMLATEADLENVVKLLLRSGADPNSRLQYGLPLLIFYIQKDDTKMAQFLLDTGASILQTTNRGKSVLHVACQSGALTTVRWIIENAWRDKQATGYPIVENEVDSKNEQIRRLLSISDIDGSTPLHSAARSGNIEVLDYLIRLGMDPKCKDLLHQGILEYACRTGSLEMIARILELNIEMQDRQDTWSALHWAARCHNFRAMDMLIKAGEQSYIVKTSEPIALWSPADMLMGLAKATLTVRGHRLWHNTDTEVLQKIDSPQSWAQSGLLRQHNGSFLPRRSNNLMYNSATHVRTGSTAASRIEYICGACELEICGPMWTCRIGFNQYDQICFMCRHSLVSLDNGREWREPPRDSTYLISDVYKYQMS